MAEAIVTEILDDNAKSGMGKNGKPWSMSRVGLNNGESVFIFNPIDIGQVVESHQDGEYINWKPKKADPKHDEIMKALREIYKAITVGVSDPLPPEEMPTIKVDPPAETKTTPLKQEVDKVYPVDETEEVDLKDVPF